MNIPEDVQNDADALAAWHIYERHWSSSLPSYGGQIDLIENAANELKTLIIVSPNASECIYSSIDTLEKFFT
jgi:hypothetical protein